MKKRIFQVFCVAAAVTLISAGAVAQYARKASKVAAQSSYVTGRVAPQDKEAVQFLPEKTYSNTMGLSLEQSATCRLTMPEVTVTSTMEAIRQATGVVNFAGCVIFSEATVRNGKKAIYELSSEGNDVGKLLSTANTSMKAGLGACVVDDKYYTLSGSGSTWYLSCYDMENGFVELSSLKLSSTQMSEVLLYDGINVYGTFVTATSGQYTFGTMDLATGTVTPIATVDYNMIAGGVDAQGNLYGIVMGDPDAYLIKVNKQTGAMTKIGNGLGVVPKYRTGAVIDPASGRMFYNVCPADETGNLYEIDVTTGVATKLFQYKWGDEIVGMYIPFSAQPGAPAAPENLTMSFPGGALTGEVSFKIPATTQDGTAGSGNVTYTVFQDGNQIAQDNAGYGQTVKVPVTVSATGTYNYAVELRNAVGRSYRTEGSVFVGNDVPKSPAPVNAEYNGGTMTVSWTAVTEGVNGGYVNPSEVTYKVTCGDRVVKENYTATSLTETINENGSYKYQVVASWNGVNSEVAESNQVVVGTRSLPAEFRFITQKQFAEFTVIDANNDGITWTHNAAKKMAECKWNVVKDMDDWLISPPVELKGGNVYKVTSIMHNGNKAFKERYEIRIGQGTTVEAMTNTLVEPAELTTSDTIPVESLFQPTADGRYNIGVHGISEKDNVRLYAICLRIEEVDGGIPAEVTDLVATADAQGALSAKIDFKAPAKSINGSALASLTKIELRRGETVIHDFTNPTPGAGLTWTDNTMTAPGNYEYTVTAYNDKGQSSPVSTTLYVGLDVPDVPTDVTMTEVSDGRVKITWKAPEKDVNGKPLNPADITYEIRDAGASGYPLIKEVGNVLQYEFDAVEAGKCELVQFAVFAVTSVGRGDGTRTPFMAIGTPIPTPYVEGFDPIANPLGAVNLSGSNQWSFMKVNSTVTYTPDGDQKFLVHKGGTLDATSIAYTAKVDLRNVENPVFSFYTFNIGSDDPTEVDINEVTVVAREPNTANWTIVKKAATVNDLCGGRPNTWGRVAADLSAFKGKVVQVGVMAKCKLYSYTMFDKWRITTEYEDDLTAENITARSKVLAGDELPVQVKVTNIGKNAASNFSVELYEQNGETPIATKTIGTLASMCDDVVEFRPVFAPGQAGEHTLYAKVVYAADKHQDDNTTGNVSFTVTVSEQPAPTNLVAKLDEEHQSQVVLNWGAPAGGGLPATVTDDVESYNPWNYTGVGDWKFVDKDGKKTGGLQNMNIPGLTPGETVTSFFTFSQTGVNGNATFAAHSGDKYFAAIFPYDDTQSNDWLISPELDGSAQTISFWARSYSAQYPEKIEVYTSTGSENPGDFTAVEGSLVASVPDAWTKYEVTLPAGAKRFAIHSFATGSFMLMIDDITYMPKDAKPAVLVGYNVYRDNVKVNSEVIPAGTTTFKDINTQPETAYNYYVTAVYDSGEESAATYANPITTSVPGLGMGDVTISVVDNTIVVENATETVTVTDMGGVVLFRGRNNRVAVTVGKGAYIVSTGKLTEKVMVK